MFDNNTFNNLFIDDAEITVWTKNSNGTIEYSSFGVGLLFLPSGIGYFENSTADIPEYSPLIFTVSLTNKETAPAYSGEKFSLYGSKIDIFIF